MRLNIHEIKQSAQLVLDWHSYYMYLLGISVKIELYVFI